MRSFWETKLNPSFFAKKTLSCHMNICIKILVLFKNTEEYIKKMHNLYKKIFSKIYGDEFAHF